MSAKSATLAKSLHTVSAIVAVARHVRAAESDARLAMHRGGACPAPDSHYWTARALAILGYAGAADPYGLRARATAILARDAQ